MPAPHPYPLYLVERGTEFERRMWPDAPRLVIWTGAALIVIIVARQTRHREGWGTGFKVGVDDEVKVSRPRDG